MAANIGSFFQGLKTIATEFSSWEDSTRRLDILAIDTDRNLYVIEFKRDNDAAHAELQAIRYAAMLSVCDVEDLIQAGYQYRKKKDEGFQKEAWQAELLKFLGEEAVDDIELRPIPRIVLVSSQFNKEITTTVLWLNQWFGSTEEDVPGMDITCFEMGVYEFGGQRALHFDQIIPISQAEEYQVKARAKDLDSAKKQAKSKRARSVTLLESSGKLQQGSKIVLMQGAFKALADMSLQDREATFIGKGQFRWEADGQIYGGCAEFCVNGQSTAGVSRPVRKHNEHQETRRTRRTAVWPAGQLQEARRPHRRERSAQATYQAAGRASPGR